MKDSPRTEFDDEESVNLPKELVDHREEVTSPGDLGVILE